MRTRLLTALCILAMSPAVRAQDAMDPSQEESTDTTSETEAQDVVEEGDKVRLKKDPNARDSAPGETHTVVRGDTLWDLSQKYLGSPWYWPKVWSYNPEIANPHWIYPGNQIRFATAGEEVPTRLDVAGEEGDAVENGDAEAETEAEAQKNELAGPDGSGLSVAGKIGYQGGGTAGGGRMVMVNGFVTAKEIEEAGRITGSFEEKEMLSYPDRAYVSFKNRADARVGDKYLVFKTDEKPVKHPVTGEKVGYLTHILGTMKVVSLADKTVTAQVTGSRDEIVRGNLVGPAGESLDRQVAPKANDRALEATVVTALVPYLTILGEHHVLVVDKGAADGVQPGNTFVAFRQQDLGGNFMHPQKDQDKDLPKEDIASCMALDVKDRFSTCVLIRSIREVVPGDRLEMRVGGAATASR